MTSSTESPPVSLKDSLRSPPTSVRENAIYRDQLLTACANDPQLAADVTALCAKDILWCFNSFFWTFDPRRASGSRPFILWPYQAEFVQTMERHYRERKDILIEKSRDMGATWLVLCWLFHHWRFEPGFQALIGSRLEELIDKRGDMASHFERLRWEAKLMPAWWMPQGFDLSKHSPYMQLANTENGCAILGQAVTPGFSRQGRYNCAVGDEFAFCESAEEAWRAMGDSTPVRVVMSSVKGLGNKFATLRRSGTVQVLSLHWSLHPEKSKGIYCQEHGNPALASCQWPVCKLSSPWYDSERSRRAADPTSIAEELDIDYLSSGNPYFPLADLEKQVPKPPRWKGYFVEVDHKIEFRLDPSGTWWMWDPYDPSTTYALGADPSEGIGQDRSVAVIRDSRERALRCSLACQLRPDEFAFEIEKAARYYGQAKVLCEREGPGYAVNLDLSRAYGNLWYETKVDEVGNVQGKRFGWSTNLKTRPVILSQVAEEIRDHSAKMLDIRLIEECRTFIVDENGKPRADDGFHDDYVMAWAICGFGLQGLAYSVKSPFVRKRTPQREVQKRTSLV